MKEKLEKLKSEYNYLWNTMVELGDLCNNLNSLLNFQELDEDDRNCLVSMLNKYKTTLGEVEYEVNSLRNTLYGDD